MIRLVFTGVKRLYDWNREDRFSHLTSNFLNNFQDTKELNLAYFGFLKYVGALYSRYCLLF